MGLDELRRCGVLFLAALVMSACATSRSPGAAGSGAMANAESLVQGAAAVAATDKPRALTILDEAGKAFPTDPRPWLETAQIHFDSANYSGAIVAAEEAIKRDPSSAKAQGLILVASMRLAVKYVGDLRTFEGADGPVRADAEKLVDTLRETLGQEVLVPPAAVAPAAESKRSAKRRRAAPATSSATVSSRPMLPRPAAAPAPSPTGGDPFGALK